MTCAAALLRVYVVMLENGSLGTLPCQARSSLPIMTTKLAAMNHLINQTVQAARLEDNELHPRQRRLDLRDVVRSAVQVVTPIRDAKPRIRVEDPASQVPVLVEPGEMEPS